MITTRLFRQMIAALVLAGAGIVALPAAAGAPAEPASSGSSETESDDSENAGKTDGEKTTADTRSSEVFIPTEEISEDFAVSFPVDI